MSKQVLKISRQVTGVGLCHNLPLPSKEYAALEAEHKLTNIFRLASVHIGHRQVAAGRHNYDKVDPTGDNDP